MTPHASTSAQFHHRTASDSCRLACALLCRCNGLVGRPGVRAHDPAARARAGLGAFSAPPAAPGWCVALEAHRLTHRCTYCTARTRRGRRCPDVCAVRRRSVAQRRGATLGPSASHAALLVTHAQECVPPTGLSGSACWWVGVRGRSRRRGRLRGGSGRAGTGATVVSRSRRRQRRGRKSAASPPSSWHCAEGSQPAKDVARGVASGAPP